MFRHSDLFLALYKILLRESGHFVYFRVIYNVELSFLAYSLKLVDSLNAWLFIECLLMY